MTTRTHTFVQITDTHLIADELLHGAVDPAANLQRALECIPGRVPELDALLLTGDLANDGDPVAYDRLRGIVDTAAGSLGVPVLYGIGNHDERVAFRDRLLDGRAAPAGSRAAGDGRDPAAPIDYVAEINGLRIVMVDSTVPGHHYGEVTVEQLAWLSAVLATPAPAGSLLTIHHPPFAWNEEGPGADFKASSAFVETGGLAQAVRGSDVKLILAGHHHEPRAGQLGGVPIWAGPSTAMAHEMGPDFDSFRIVPSSGISVIDVFADGSAVARAVNCIERPVLFEMSMDDLRRRMAESSHPSRERVMS